MIVDTKITLTYSKEEQGIQESYIENSSCFNQTFNMFASASRWLNISLFRILVRVCDCWIDELPFIPICHQNMLWRIPSTRLVDEGLCLFETMLSQGGLRTSYGDHHLQH